MKKIGALLLLVLVLLTGCKKEVKNIEGTLPEIMEKLYAGIPEEEMPMYVENIELDNDTIENFIGTPRDDYNIRKFTKQMPFST